MAKKKENESVLRSLTGHSQAHKRRWAAHGSGHFEQEKDESERFKSSLFASDRGSPAIYAHAVVRVI